MTPKTSSSSVTWLALATALLAAVPARAQSLSDADFAGSLAAISASSAKTAAQQKIEAARKPRPAPSAPAAPAASGNRVTPDYSFTPGHLCQPGDPNFKEYRYAEHIPYCNRNVTEEMKQTVAAHYGVPQSDWSGYEFDHLIPLAIGGDSSNDNVWPQPHGDPDGSNGKDKLEDLLYREIAAGTITQAAAVKQIYGWFTASDMAAAALQVTSR
jgi:hypothetical protein